MTILVYKDGRWLIDNEQPLEGVSLDNLAAILSNPKDGDVVKYDEESGMWIAGEAGGGGSSGGGVLVVTVTSQDGNLIADKTAGEIINAMPLVYEIQETVGDGVTMSSFVPLSKDGNAQPAYGYKEETGYYFYYMDADYNEYTLIAATLDDYPTASLG